MDKICVYYASETGTAVECCERIRRKLKRRHLSSNVSALDTFQFDDIPSFAIFVVATTGDGEEPRNMTVNNSYGC